MMDIDDVERFWINMERSESVLAFWPWMIAGMILAVYDAEASIYEWMRDWDWRFEERYECR